MLKYRITAILATLVLIIGLGACGRPKTPVDDPSSANSIGGDGQSPTDAVIGGGTATTGSGETTSGDDPSGSVDNSGTTKSGQATATKTKTTPPGPNTIKDDIQIKTSSTPLEKGLNFGGKTYRMLISKDKEPTESDKRMIAAFEKAYNCKLTYDVVAFDNMIPHIGSKMSTGTVYDIIYLHGSMFPLSAVQRLVQPLESTITTADLYNSANSSAGGIYLERSKYFSQNDHLYALSGYDDVNVYFMYYNKQKFDDAGLKDPLSLYKQGKWTWDEFLKMGKAVTNTSNGIYFGDASFKEKGIPESFGGKYITADNGVVTVTTSDAKLFAGLQFVQKISYGADKIINIAKGNGTDPAEFLAGNTYAFMGEESIYLKIASSVINDKKLGGKISNIGYVPLPLGGSNTSYPGGWICGIASGRGASEPKIAAAWAKFRTTWTDPQAETIAYPSEMVTLMQAMRKDVNFVNYGYGDRNRATGEAVDNIVHSVETAIAQGQDIRKTLDSVKGRIQSCIDKTLNK